MAVNLGIKKTLKIIEISVPADQRVDGIDRKR
jgi:hypothetical protein